jgi:serine/threonine-protein kinase HipA
MSAVTPGSARALDVLYRDRLVGVLRDEGPAWTFSYDPSWIATPDSFDLSPALRRAAGVITDGGSQRPVQWFFDNLLPEEEARTLLAREAHVDHADAFGLLQWYGAESAGALVLSQPGQLSVEKGLQPLPGDVLSRRIRNLPRHSLGEGAPKRMSMAGAQHKLAVVVLHGELYEPVGSTPSTHILKPDHAQSDHYPHTVANEWFCMRLAAAVGLPVPAVSARAVPEPIYLTERFDREGTWPDLERLHVLDACQLLSIDRAFKYLKSTPATFNQLIQASRMKALTRRSLFRWSVFNAIIGNGDAHLKNLSFFVRNTGIELAPHYDLVSTASYGGPGSWAMAELSVAMGSATRSGALRRSDVLAFGTALGIPDAVGERLLGELLAVLPTAAAHTLEQAHIEPAFINDPGALRQLRLITHGVVGDMCRQLTN